MEEEYRKQDDTKDQSTHEKVHVMEEGNPSKSSKKRNRDFGKSHENNNENDHKKKKKKGSYFHCGKPGHYKKECRFLKKKNKEKNSSAIKDNLVVISEINMIEDVDSWWIDSDATRHVCKNKDLFKTIDEENGSVFYMGNASIV